MRHVSYAIRTVTPTDEIPLPFSVAAAKAHLKVEHSDEDVLIEAMLRAAMDHIEAHTSQILTPRVMEMSWGAFPCLPELITIPRDPVTGIEALSYTDGDGEMVALTESDWRWSEAAPSNVLPAFRTPWPTAAAEPGSVRMQFVGGYEEGLLPASLAHAVKLMLGHLHANRETVVIGTIATELPMGVGALCGPYRRVSI